MKKVLFGFALLTSLAVNPLRADLFWSDSMGYPPVPGLITTNSGGLWINHSGSQDTLVEAYPGSSAALAGNRYEVNQNLTGDIHRWFTTSTNQYYTSSSASLYASFIVAVTNLPDNAGGTYFAHFMDTSTFFRGRVFAMIPPNPYPYTSAALGTFRFGVANAQGDAASGTNGPNVIVPMDLALNTDYQVVLKVDLSAQTSTIWVNPTSESDTATSSGPALDNGPYASTNFLAALAFRQAVGEGILEIRNVRVGTSFSDVATGTPAIPVIGMQPANVTSYSANAAVLEVAASGMGALTYQWYQNGSPLPGQTSQLYVMNSLGAGDVGTYYCAVSNSAGGLLSSSAYVSVNTTPTAPTITTQPQNSTNYLGDTAQLSAFAAGTGPLMYQWRHAGTNISDGTPGWTGDASVISGSQSPYLTIANCSTFETGNYTCIVTSGGGTTPPSVTSNPAYLTVLPPRAVSIAYLRGLEDPTTWQSTNTTTLFNITGVITMMTNLSNGQSSYYIQDGTGGVNLFLYGTSFRPNIGDTVTASGVVSMYNNNMELICTAGNPYQPVTILSSGTNLPAPFVLDVTMTNSAAFMEALEGSVVMVTNVVFPAGTSTGTANTTVKTATVGGVPFLIFFPSGTDKDIASHTCPTFAYTITGVLNQFLSGTYSSTGYEINVSRWQDIVATAPPAVKVGQAVAGANLVLTWPAAPYSTLSSGAYCYSVLAADKVTGPYATIASGLTFNNTLGTYTVTNALSGSQKFYRVVSW